MKKTILMATAFAFVGAAFAQDSFSFAGPISSNGPAGSSFNGTATGTAANNYILAATVNNINAILTEVNTGTYASEARIRVRNSGWTGASDYADLQVFTTGNYTGSVTAAGLTKTMTGGLIGKSILAGSTWSFSFFESYDDGGTASIDQNWTNLSFDFTAAPPPVAPSATMLGNITPVYPEMLSNTATYAASAIKWYKFHLDNATTTGGNGITINTLLNGSGTNIDDTELALFDASGNLVDSDDDDDDNNLGYSTTRSHMQFGAGKAANLSAGDYYVAVGAYNSTFGWGFSATSTSTYSGDITLAIQAVPEPASVLALGLGAVALLRRKRS